jgi:molybdopterin-guanine dinucleotide biosynthesis protein A
MLPNTSAALNQRPSETESSYAVDYRWRPLLYGLLVILFGFGLYLTTVVLAALSRLIPGSHFGPILHSMLWYSGLPVFAGICLCAVELFLLLPITTGRRPKLHFEDPGNTQLTVVLTAYNDEQSIGMAVEDFKAHPRVARVIVLDNNSKDGTAEAAHLAGAEVIVERQPGYGRCVFRALTEGARQADTEYTLLCEGDMTFRAYDIDKFLAYLPHADIVNGTRIVEQLRDQETQLTTFMYYGNFFVGKLLEAKHAGLGTFTDVGTTYKLCRNKVLSRLLPTLDPAVNLEFNAHFLDTALSCRLRVVECPITFHPRVGLSKGGNTNNVRALRVGLSMIAGMVFSWNIVREKND